MPQQVEDIETIKKKVINLWLVMHARHRSGERSLENDELESLINNLLQLKEQLPNLNDRNLRKIIYLYENLKKDKVKDINKCYFDLFKALTSFVSKLEAYVQKERIKHWGVFLFSKIFPNTFNYLKEYIGVRYLEYYSKEIPEIKVELISSSQVHYLDKRFSNSKSLSEQMRYIPSGFKGCRIKIDLTVFSLGNQLKTNDDVKKILKLLDTRPIYQSLLIHEYQHFMQDKKKFKVYNPFTWGSLDLHDNLPRDIGIRLIHELEDAYPELKKRKDAFISHVLDKNNLYMINLEKKAFWEGAAETQPYEFRPIEIEARLSQLIFMLIKGYKLENAINVTLNPICNVNKAKEDLSVLLDSRKDQEKLIESETNQVEVVKLKKRIEYIEKEISIHKQFINDMTYLTQEAKRVAGEIIRKRQETEIK
ncbi:MAG: hypothetical protein AABW92_00340 [Nanoarchaeota archaeon]